MTIINDITAISRAAAPHIVLAEGDDPRVAEAAMTSARNGIARLSLIGKPDLVRRHLGDAYEQEGITIHDPLASAHLETYTERYWQLREHKGVTRDLSLIHI